MTRFRDGDASAFDALLGRHRRGVYGYLLRSVATAAEADDLFQEVFLRVIRAAPRWRPEAKVTTWLYTIVRNVAIDAARRRKARVDSVPLASSPDEPGHDIGRVADHRPRADEHVLRAEIRGAVDELVRELPPEQAEVFLLKSRGLTFDDVGRLTGTSRNTAKSRLRYALKRLRRGLAERGLLGREETP